MGAERAQEDGHVHHRREVVRVRVADVGADGLASVCIDHRHEPALDLRKRVVPGGGLEAAAAADERRAEAIGVRVEVLQRVRLRTDEAVAEDVVGVTADGGDLGAARRDREPTGRFAQGTGPEMRHRRYSARQGTPAAEYW